MKISGQTRTILQLTGTKQLDLSMPTDSFTPTSDMGITWADGSAVNQAEELWHDQRTLSDDQTEELELTHGGVEVDLVDAFGDEVVFTSIKAIYIYNGSADASLIIGGTPANPSEADEWLGFLASVGDTILLGPGGHLYADCPSAAGWAVAAGELFKMTHNGTGTDDLTYDIMLLGTM